jgi:putative ABC transport system permease protein
MFTVMISVVVMEFVAGIMDGMKEDFYNSILKESGHVQIHHIGYKDRLDQFSLSYLIDNPDSVITRLKSNPVTADVEKIIHFGAMLLKDDKNLTIAGHGTEAGTGYYENAKEKIIAGSFLPEPRSIVLSKAIAGLLRAEIGDYVNVLVVDANGSPYYLDYRLAGIFETGIKTFDEYNFFIIHEDAAELLDIPGRTVEIRVRLIDSQLAPEFAKSIKPKLDEAGLTASTWEQIHGSLVSIIRLFDFFMIFINIFIVIVAATVITNAILMNQFKRFKEFGMMRAIGLKKQQLFSLIVTEGSLEGCFGSLSGLLICVPLVLYFSRYGLFFGAAMETFGFSSSIYFVFTLKSMLVNLVSGILIAVAGSLYAAFVCTKMPLIDTLNSV